LFSAPSAKKAGEEADKDLSTFSGSVAGKSIPAVATLLYIYWVFVSELPPGNSLVNSDPSTLKLAMELSENFWFILPALNFDWVPSINPVMEGLFNFVVTWMIMMFGFYSEERYQRRVKMLPFLAMMPFLTNAVYLPYLAIREPTGKALSLDDTKELNMLESVTESKNFGRLLGLVGLLSIAWALLGRQEFGQQSLKRQY